MTIDYTPFIGSHLNCEEANTAGLVDEVAAANFIINGSPVGSVTGALNQGRGPCSGFIGSGKGFSRSVAGGDGWDTRQTTISRFTCMGWGRLQAGHGATQEFISNNLLANPATSRAFILRGVQFFGPGSEEGPVFLGWDGSTFALSTGFNWTTPIPHNEWYFLGFSLDFTVPGNGRFVGYIRVPSIGSSVIIIDPIPANIFSHTGTGVVLIGIDTGSSSGGAGFEVDHITTFLEYAVADAAEFALFSQAPLVYPGGFNLAGASGVLIDNVSVQSAGWGEGKFSGSVSVRAAADNIAGYLRQNIQPTDDSSSDSPLGSPGGNANDLTTRRVRNYYTIPPAAWWQQYRMRVDLAESALNRKEDGFRYYMRLYKHLQTLRFDGPCVTEGLLGRSFIHPNNPSADEDIRWTGVIGLNALQLEFRWLPNFSCVDVPDTDLELARFEIDASNFLSLKVLAGDATQREYNQHDIHGPHEPTLRLSKTRLGSEVASVDLVTYWGYDLREPSLERLDDVLLLTIQHSTVGLSLRVDKYGGFGEKRTADDLTAFAGNGLGDIVYNGSGYYGSPVVVDENADREVNGVRRRVKFSRPDLARRLFVQERNMVAAGERDTTNGQRINDQPFLLEEDFVRSDDPNLGSNWDIIRQTGNGFNIVSNKASCTDNGFERWDAAPRHRDYVVEADVAVAADGDLVGVIGRYPNEFFNSSFASSPTVGGGLGMELVQLTSSTAELRLVAWWLDVRGLTYDTTALSAYTAGVEYRMRLTLSGSTITGTIAEIGTGTVLATVSGTSTLFQKPGRIVIYGEAPTSPVTIDRIVAIPNFVTGLA